MARSGCCFITNWTWQWYTGFDTTTLENHIAKIAEHGMTCIRNYGDQKKMYSNGKMTATAKACLHQIYRLCDEHGIKEIMQGLINGWGGVGDPSNFDVPVSCIEDFANEFSSYADNIIAVTAEAHTYADMNKQTKLPYYEKYCPPRNEVLLKHCFKNYTIYVDNFPNGGWNPNPQDRLTWQDVKPLVSCYNFGLYGWENFVHQGTIKTAFQALDKPLLVGELGYTGYVPLVYDSTGQVIGGKGLEVSKYESIVGDTIKDLEALIPHIFQSFYCYNWAGKQWNISANPTILDWLKQFGFEKLI
jgi:hypothetical protein